MTRRSAHGLVRFQWAAVIGVGATVSACTKAQTPPPPADAAAPSSPSVPVAAHPSQVVPTDPPAAPTESAPAPLAPASTATAAVSSNPWTTPSDCSKANASASQRARVLATCQAKEEFRSFVAARQSCKAASDCAVVSGACPFGCFVPAAKASVSEVTAKLDQLGALLDQAGGRCVYRCVGRPAAACVEGRCSAGAP